MHGGSDSRPMSATASRYGAGPRGRQVSQGRWPIIDPALGSGREAGATGPSHSLARRWSRGPGEGTLVGAACPGNRPFSAAMRIVRRGQPQRRSRRAAGSSLQRALQPSPPGPFGQRRPGPARETNSPLRYRTSMLSRTNRPAIKPANRRDRPTKKKPLLRTKSPSPAPVSGTAASPGHGRRTRRHGTGQGFMLPGIRVQGPPPAMIPPSAKTTARSMCARRTIQAGADDLDRRLRTPCSGRRPRLRDERWCTRNQGQRQPPCASPAGDSSYARHIPAPSRRLDDRRRPKRGGAPRRWAVK